MSPRRFIIAAILIALLACIGGAVRHLWFQSPREQMERAQARFLRAVEKRDWDTISSLLKDNYMDEFGYDKETGLEVAKQLLSGFLTLEIEARQTHIVPAPDLGFIQMTLKLEGNGNAVAQMAAQRVNETKAPWTFHWKKTGKWPWEWQIVQIHNTDLVP